jgi:hypothetical protein
MAKWSRSKKAPAKISKDSMVAAQTITVSEVPSIAKGWPTSFYTIILNQDLSLDDETAIIVTGKLPCFLLAYNTILIDGKNYRTATEAANAFTEALVLAGLKTPETVVRAFANRVLPAYGKLGTLLYPDIFTVSSNEVENGGVSSCTHLVEVIATKMPNETKEYRTAWLAGGRFAELEVNVNGERIQKTGVIGTWSKGGPVKDEPDPCSVYGDDVITCDCSPYYNCLRVY